MGNINKVVGGGGGGASNVPLVPTRPCSAAALALCEASPCIDLFEDTGPGYSHVTWLTAPGAIRVKRMSDNRVWDAVCSGTCYQLLGTWIFVDFYEDIITINAINQTDYDDDFTVERTNDHVYICSLTDTYGTGGYSDDGGNGGDGHLSTILGVPYYFAGGGGGSGYATGTRGGDGGRGGGGGGGIRDPSNNYNGIIGSPGAGGLMLGEPGCIGPSCYMGGAGANRTGSGGGAATHSEGVGGPGGSGVVIIRFRDTAATHQQEETIMFTGVENSYNVILNQPVLMELLVVAGGGGGGNSISGGGGAGGVLHVKGAVVDAGEYTVVVGDGGHGKNDGSAGTYPGKGQDSWAFGARAVGGGAGGGYWDEYLRGGDGGSGGGGAGVDTSYHTAGGLASRGSIGPVLENAAWYSFFGNVGGQGGGRSAGNIVAGGGGGGASGPGVRGNDNQQTPVNGSYGGAGLKIPILGRQYTEYYWAGGGAGDGWYTNGGWGGVGGGGAGANGATGAKGFPGVRALVNPPGMAFLDPERGGFGAPNTGGGGGSGAFQTSVGGDGGSGIVIMRAVPLTLSNAPVVVEPTPAPLQLYETVVTIQQVSKSIRSFSFNRVQRVQGSSGTTAVVHTIDSGEVSDCQALAGFYSSTPGFVHICPEDSFCPVRSEQPQSCPGVSSSALGSDHPDDCICDPGYHGLYECAECIPGNFCPGGDVGNGEGEMISCGGMGYSSPVASTKPSDCFVVPGYYIPSGTPQLCVEGFYCPGGDGLSIIACPIRMTSPPGSSLDSHCYCPSPSEEIEVNGQRDCTGCPIGFYCPGGDLFNPLPCPSGSTSREYSSELSDCICSDGHYAPDPFTSCKACPENYYCRLNSLTFCGNYTSSPANSSMVSQCQVNAGYYRNDNTSILQCPGGGYSPKGSVSVYECWVVPGYVNHTHLCPPGSYCSFGNRFECPDGSTSPEGAAWVSDCRCASGLQKYYDSSEFSVQTNFSVLSQILAPDVGVLFYFQDSEYCLKAVSISSPNVHYSWVGSCSSYSCSVSEPGRFCDTILDISYLQRQKWLVVLEQGTQFRFVDIFNRESRGLQTLYAIGAKLDDYQTHATINDDQYCANTACGLHGYATASDCSGCPVWITDPCVDCQCYQVSGNSWTCNTNTFCIKCNAANGYLDNSKSFTLPTQHTEIAYLESETKLYSVTDGDIYSWRIELYAGSYILRAVDPSFGLLRSGSATTLRSFESEIFFIENEMILSLQNGIVQQLPQSEMYLITVLNNLFPVYQTTDGAYFVQEEGEIVRSLFNWGRNVSDDGFSYILNGNTIRIVQFAAGPTCEVCSIGDYCPTDRVIPIQCPNGTSSPLGSSSIYDCYCVFTIKEEHNLQSSIDQAALLAEVSSVSLGAGLRYDVSASGDLGELGEAYQQGDFTIMLRWTGRDSDVILDQVTNIGIIFTRSYSTYDGPIAWIEHPSGESAHISFGLRRNYALTCYNAIEDPKKSSQTHSLAFVKDGIVLSVYVDGSRICEQTAHMPYNTFFKSKSIRFGSSHDNTGTSNLNVDLSDIQIWMRPLTEDEIIHYYKHVDFQYLNTPCVIQSSGPSGIYTFSECGSLQFIPSEGTCIPCPDNSLCNGSHVQIGCRDGFYLDSDNLCQRCRPSYYCSENVEVRCPVPTQLSHFETAGVDECQSCPMFFETYPDEWDPAGCFCSSVVPGGMDCYTLSGNFYIDGSSFEMCDLSSYYNDETSQCELDTGLTATTTHCIIPSYCQGGQTLSCPENRVTHRHGAQSVKDCLCPVGYYTDSPSVSNELQLDIYPTNGIGFAFSKYGNKIFFVRCKGAIWVYNIDEGTYGSMYGRCDQEECATDGDTSTARFCNIMRIQGGDNVIMVYQQSGTTVQIRAIDLVTNTVSTLLSTTFSFTVHVEESFGTDGGYALRSSDSKTLTFYNKDNSVNTTATLWAQDVWSPSSPCYGETNKILAGVICQGNVFWSMNVCGQDSVGWKYSFRVVHQYGPDLTPTWQSGNLFPTDVDVAWSEEIGGGYVTHTTNSITGHEPRNMYCIGDSVALVSGYDYTLVFRPHREFNYNGHPFEVSESGLSNKYGTPIALLEHPAFPNQVWYQWKHELQYQFFTRHISQSNSEGTCFQCPENFYCVDEALFQCPEGSTSPVESTSLEDCKCPIGTYRDGITCVACAEGETTLAIGSISASDCDCDINYYRQDLPPPNNVCRKCQLNSFTTGYGSDGQESCRCIKGFYSAVSMPSNFLYCANCVGDLTTKESGSTSPNDCICVPGQYRSGVSCVECPVNSYCFESFRYNCPDNTRSNASSTSSSACVTNAGYYKETDDGAALPCPIGYYCPGVGSSRRIQCPVNATTLALAQLTISDCQCVPSFYRLDLETCEPCPEDHYCVNDTFTYCGNKGISPPMSGRKEDCFCLPGYFLGEVKCVECGSTSYCINSTQFDCPVGSIAFGFNSTRIEDCVCRDGFYVLENRTCVQCPAGTYCDTQFVKQDCPVALTTSLPGSVQESDCYCKPGYYGPSIGPCVECKADFFCPGGDEHFACPKGTHSQPQSSAVTQCLCPAGFFSTSSGTVLTGFVNVFTPPTFTSTCLGQIDSLTELSGSASGGGERSTFPTSCTFLIIGRDVQFTAHSTASPFNGGTNSWAQVWECHDITCTSNTFLTRFAGTESFSFDSMQRPNLMGYRFFPGGGGAYGMTLTYWITWSATSKIHTGIYPGWVYNASSGQYNGCSAGKYGDGENCSSCPSNASYTGSVGANSVQDCKDTQPTVETNFCALCPADGYCPGNNRIVECPEFTRTYNRSGSVSNVSCDCDLFSYPTGFLQCTECPANSKRWNRSSVTCECHHGYYNSYNGEGIVTSCIQCPVGSYCTFGTRYECEEGKGSAAGSETKYACICSPGFYIINTTDCVSCPENGYCDGIVFQTCPEHSVGPAGASSVDSCECADGYYLLSSICEDCGTGYYCSAGARTQCPGGQITPTTTATSALECECGPGFYGLECVECASDSYCPNGVNVTKCPPGTNSVPPRTSSADCECIKGYRRISGVCEPCDTGYYCPGSTRFKCPMYSSSESASTSIDNCTCSAGFVKQGTDCFLDGNVSECFYLENLVNHSAPYPDTAGVHWTSQFLLSVSVTENKMRGVSFLEDPPVELFSFEPGNSGILQRVSRTWDSTGFPFVVTYGSNVQVVDFYETVGDSVVGLLMSSRAWEIQDLFYRDQAVYILELSPLKTSSRLRLIDRMDIASGLSNNFMWAEFSEPLAIMTMDFSESMIVAFSKITHSVGLYNITEPGSPEAETLCFVSNNTDTVTSLAYQSPFVYLTYYNDTRLHVIDLFTCQMAKFPVGESPRVFPVSSGLRIFNNSGHSLMTASCQICNYTYEGSCLPCANKTEATLRTLECDAAVTLQRFVPEIPPETTPLRTTTARTTTIETTTLETTAAETTVEQSQNQTTVTQQQQPSPPTTTELTPSTSLTLPSTTTLDESTTTLGEATHTIATDLETTSALTTTAPPDTQRRDFRLHTDSEGDAPIPWQFNQIVLGSVAIGTVLSLFFISVISQRRLYQRILPKPRGN